MGLSGSASRVGPQRYAGESPTPVAFTASPLGHSFLWKPRNNPQRFPGTSALCIAAPPSLECPLSSRPASALRSGLQSPRASTYRPRPPPPPGGVTLLSYRARLSREGKRSKGKSVSVDSVFSFSPTMRLKHSRSSGTLFVWPNGCACTPTRPPAPMTLPGLPNAHQWSSAGHLLPGTTSPDLVELMGAPPPAAENPARGSGS